MPFGFVLPKHYYEKVGMDLFGQTPIGTRLYLVDSYNPFIDLKTYK